MRGPLRTTGLTLTLIGIGEIDSVPDWEVTTSAFFEGVYDEERPGGVRDVAVGVTATMVEVFRGSDDAAAVVTYIQETWYLADGPDWSPGEVFALVPLSTESRRDDYVFRLSSLDGYEGLTDVLEIDASAAVTRDAGAAAGVDQGSGGVGVATMGAIVGISVFVAVVLLAAIVAGIVRFRRGGHDDDWLNGNTDEGHHDGDDHKERPSTSTLEYHPGGQEEVRTGLVSPGEGAGFPTGGVDWSLLGDDKGGPPISAPEYHPRGLQDVRTASASASSGDGAAQTTRVEVKPPSTPSTLSISKDTPTIGTFDHNYAAAYGEGADHSHAGGTAGSRTRQTGPGGLEEGVPTMAPPGPGNTILSDDLTFDEAYEDVREILLDVYAPAGRLGVIIDTPDDGAPVIHAIKEDSPILDKVRVGDKLVAVDDDDVRAMTAVKVSRLISTKANNPSRKFTIIRQERKA